MAPSASRIDRPLDSQKQQPQSRESETMLKSRGKENERSAELECSLSPKWRPQT